MPPASSWSIGIGTSGSPCSQAIADAAGRFPHDPAAKVLAVLIASPAQLADTSLTVLEELLELWPKSEVTWALMETVGGGPWARVVLTVST